MTFYAGPEHGALGLVESPAQLLNVIGLSRRRKKMWPRCGLKNRGARAKRGSHA